MNDLYSDIVKRTGGDIYIGVVGPVRVGKSTFIKKFMDELVIDNIVDINEKTRIIDELPQSGDGKSIMTTQPHFVPNSGVLVNLDGNVRSNIRMIDCVGYLVSDALGTEENGKERLVRTPWTDEEIPFKEAAELGTSKVIREHSTIGVLVTTDGSFGEFTRQNFVSAEERIASELRGYKKPYVVLLNTKNPKSAETNQLVNELSKKYNVPVVAKDVINMTKGDIADIMNEVLLEFPLKLIDVNAPKWIQALSEDNSIVVELKKIIAKGVEDANKMRDFDKIKEAFSDAQYFESPNVIVDAGCGRIEINIDVKKEIFYDIISKECGHNIIDDFMLMSYFRFLKKAETEYSKLKNALDEVYATGYGIVCPKQDEMQLEQPETYKQGGQFGIKIKASAPSLHIVKVDVDTEIRPIIGDEEQCGNFAESLINKYDDDKDAILQTNIFGKTVNDLLNDGLNNKANMIQEETKAKMRKTLTKIVNEGKGGVLCILL